MTTETTDFADFREIFSFCRSLCRRICCCFLLFVLFCLLFCLFVFFAPLSQLSGLGRCFCCFFWGGDVFVCLFVFLFCCVFLVVSLAPLS